MSGFQPPSSLSSRARWIIYFVVMTLLIAMMVLIYFAPAILPLMVVPVVVIIVIDTWRRNIRNSRGLTRMLDPSGAYPVAVINPAQCSKCGYDCSGVDRLLPCPECGKPAPLPELAVSYENHCFFCDYNRSGLDKNALCPECGNVNKQVPRKPYQR